MYFFEEFPLWNRFRSHTPAGFYHKTKGHSGEDYGTPIGTPLCLPAKAKIVQILHQNQMGTTLYLEIGKEIVVFSHLSKVLGEKGRSLIADEVFAETGNTGSATTGPHVHVEVISPKPWVGYEMMTRSLGGFEGYNIPPTEYFEMLQKKEVTDKDWCVKHLKNVDWDAIEEIHKDLPTAFRGLAIQVKKWFT